MQWKHQNLVSKTHRSEKNQVTGQNYNIMLCLFRFQFKKNLHRIISQLYIRDNCHPFKASLLVWVQLPLWISLSLALRNLSVDQSGKLTLTLD